MKSFRVDYINNVSKKLDRVTFTEGETIELETGDKKITNISDVIEVFEIVAVRYWGSYETKNSITNITVNEI